jgi:hypothetical protein
MAAVVTFGMIAVVSLALFAALTPAHVAAFEPNILTCSLKRNANDFIGTCDIPCAVNALAIDLDGPCSNFSCSTPPRQVRATLRQQERFDDWLGTMEGKEPEDPTRFGVIKPKDGKPSVAKTPYGWSALTEAGLDGDMLTLSAIANRQLPPTQDDIRIINRALALIPR